jgi:GNAT acetyltransferase-like protein
VERIEPRVVALNIIEPVAESAPTADRRSTEGQIEWRGDLAPAAWDAALADLGGHPLQSALWGDARRKVDGIVDHRWMALRDGVPIWMIRVEERRLPLIGWVGWAPRGPTTTRGGGIDMTGDCVARLRGQGMRLLVIDPWREASPQGDSPRTIWIDLTRGRDVLMGGLDKDWRYGVGRAARLGVRIAEETDDSAVERFYALCRAVSQRKGFDLPASLALMQALMLPGKSRGAEATLLVARVGDKIAAGSFLIRCGRSAHYFWGATDRAFSHQRAGEAVQWASIEWALDRHCERYDLEGVDPKRNPGTYAFKKKLGGREVVLTGKQYFPSTSVGRAIAWVEAFRRR